MAPIKAWWTRVIYVFDYLSSSAWPSEFEHTPALQIPVHPISSAQPVKPASSSYPIFDPPDEYTGEPFRCEYPDFPASEGWELCNTNLDRGCWLKNTKTGQRYDINTPYETDGPRGIVRDYYLELSETPFDPDGFGPGPAQLFNGTYPGPRLQACWGDKIQVTVKNLLLGSGTPSDPGNGTTIHWHGFRQLNTGFMDGVNAITQCPIAPNETTTFTYTFNATQYGTSWYHSHYSLQYAAGALGPITIYGPVSSNFDHQLEPIVVSDWLHTSVWDQWEWYKKESRPIYIDNILQSGIGHWPPINPPNDVPGNPKFNELFFQRGVKYLIRIINAAADTTFVFSIDNHRFKVVSTDFVSIEPYETDHIVVGIGQRYNIIVEAKPDRFTADQSFWIRTSPAPKCTNFPPDAKLMPDEHTGIVRYDSSSDLPKTQRQKFDLTCADETYFRTLKPCVGYNVSEARKEMDPFYLAFNSEMKGFPYWQCDQAGKKFELIPDQPMWLNFSDPTALDLDKKFDQLPWLAEVDTGSVSDDNWVQLTIISGKKKTKVPTKPHPLPKQPGVFVPSQHPIHLHGHDFSVLDQCVPDDDHECDISKANLTLIEPPRRDVAFLPNNGYLIIAFRADNPGIWLMHCHIAFHASMGLAAQIMENRDKINWGFGWDEPLMDGCAAWNQFIKYDSGNPCGLGSNVDPLQTDSGI